MLLVKTKIIDSFILFTGKAMIELMKIKIKSGYSSVTTYYSHIDTVDEAIEQIFLDVHVIHSGVDKVTLRF